MLAKSQTNKGFLMTGRLFQQEELTSQQDTFKSLLLSLQTQFFQTFFNLYYLDYTF